MRNYPFPLAAVLALLLAPSSYAAGKPRTAQSNQTRPKKVWTNADMDDLRARGLISIVGPEESEAAQPAPAPAAETAPAAAPVEAQAALEFPVYESRLDDPEWYVEQAVNLQAELDQRVADLKQQQDAITLAKDRITQPGLALDRENAGITADSGLAVLEGRVREIQDQLDELSDLARQHSISPGALRAGEEAASS